MGFRFSLVLGLLVAAGCASDPGEVAEGGDGEDATPDAVGEAPPTEVRPGVSIDRLLDERSNAAEIVARLRAPRSLRASPTPNAYVEGQTDTVRTYVYDGLRIETYEVAAGRTFIRRIDVTGGDYGTSQGVSLGETRERIEGALGIPFQEDGNVAAYQIGPEPTPTTVEVEYDRDPSGTVRATAISWIPYLD